MNGSRKRKIGALCTLITSFGKEGGIISPSIYDTAQGLRFCPPVKGVEPALTWLASCQLSDGGWGNPIRSHTRDVPTIAALLAFATYASFLKSEEVIEAGLRFLNEHHHHWENMVPEDLPVGMELILPKLLADADELGLSIPQDHYQNLKPVYEKKIEYIRTMPLKGGTPPTFSWEAWGETPDVKWLDGTGGVGHNPTATAYWIHLSRDFPELQPERELAKAYLSTASKAMGSNIPGLLPSAWPINRFEQSLALHTLLMADLFDHPDLKEAIQEQVDDLAGGIQPKGVGFSDHFTPDGDDTAAAVAVICAMGGDVPREVLDHFAYENHYRGYIGELQASHSVTARAIYALKYYGADTTAAEHYLLSHQLSSGAWPGDKWNVSPYYGTCLATFALKDKSEQYRDRLTDAANFLVNSQLENGSWGALGVPSEIDTSYALLSLHHLASVGLIPLETFLSGQKWLDFQYESKGIEIDLRWLNKQEYSPYRIDQTFLLTALLAVPEQVFYE